MKKKNEFNYFENFEKSVGFAKDAMEELKTYVLDFKQSELENEMKKIHDIENNGDKNLHELKNYLLRDFLPPIDREDILSMAYKLDDLIDDIDEVVIDMNIYNITEITENMKDSILLLEKSLNTIYNLIVELKNLKKIQEIKAKIIEVNDIEEQADRLYENSIKELYVNQKDVINVLKWSKIYERIEDCFDTCESIAYEAESILLKNT